MIATITKFDGTADVVVSSGKLDVITDYANRENKKPGQNPVKITMVSMFKYEEKGWVKIFWSDDAICELVFDRYSDMLTWLKARKSMKGLTAVDIINPAYSFVI